MLAFDDAQILDISGPLEVFARTARWLAVERGINPPAYSIRILADRTGPVRTSGGIELIAVGRFEEADQSDTLLVSGGIGYRDAIENRRLLRVVQEAVGRGVRIGSICTGSLILAAAGVLDGRRATTHWAYGKELQRLAPLCSVEDDAIYVRCGEIYTSAGVTAGMDLALALVEQDWGRDVALSVAQELVLYLKRPGGQSQFSRMLEAQRLDDPFDGLRTWIQDHLAGDLCVRALAAQAAMSVRQFSRTFRACSNVTPAVYVEQLRVERARQRISEGCGSLKLVARQCGFRDEQGLRRAFRRQLGVSPAEYQQRFG